MRTSIFSIVLVLSFVGKCQTIDELRMLHHVSREYNLDGKHAVEVTKLNSNDFKSKTYIYESRLDKKNAKMIFADMYFDALPRVISKYIRDESYSMIGDLMWIFEKNSYATLHAIQISKDAAFLIIEEI